MNIKKELQEILAMIKENKLQAWEDNLEETKTVVILEDFDKSGAGYAGIRDDDPAMTKYNGWLERLTQLSKIV